MLYDIGAAIRDGLERGFLGGLEMVSILLGLLLSVAVVAGGIFIGIYLTRLFL